VFIIRRHFSYATLENDEISVAKEASSDFRHLGFQRTSRGKLQLAPIECLFLMDKGILILSNLNENRNENKNVAVQEAWSLLAQAHSRTSMKIYPIFTQEYAVYCKLKYHGFIMKINAEKKCYDLFMPDKNFKKTSTGMPFGQLVIQEYGMI
jgi:tRNA splicing endonuclease